MHKHRCLFVFNKVTLFFIYLCSSFACWSGVVTDKSRVVMLNDEPAQNLLLANLNNYPVMVQLWIDDGKVDSTPETAKAPIIATPAMFKMAAGEQKNIRLVNILENEPLSVEQMFWLNIYEVPPKPSEVQMEQNGQLLMLTIRTQLKVFFRPKSLTAAVDKRSERQIFTLTDQGLNIKNDSPLFMVYNQLSVLVGEHKISLEPDFLPPFSEKLLTFPQQQQIWHENEIRIVFDFIEDNGAIVHKEVIK